MEGPNVSKVEDAKRLLAYDRTVFDRYVRSVIRGGWPEATRDRGTGHLSAKNTLVHIINVHEAWLVAVAQRRWDIFDAAGRRPEDVRSWADLRAYQRRAWGSIDELMAGLTEAKLRQRVKAPWMPGRYTLHDAFYQVSFEQAHHLGEIIGVYWQADRSPPSMTWIENLPTNRSDRS